MLDSSLRNMLIYLPSPSCVCENANPKNVGSLSAGTESKRSFLTMNSSMKTGFVQRTVSNVSFSLFHLPNVHTKIFMTCVCWNITWH